MNGFGETAFSRSAIIGGDMKATEKPTGFLQRD